MPTQHSKFIYTSCKEYVHPWTDSCVSATAGLGLHTVQESLRIYTTVYLVTLLMKGKIPTATDMKKTILGILQSTAFLSWSSFTYSMFICSLRRLMGNFNVLSVSFFPSFLSSLLAIVIERPSRQTLLSLYVSNIATETLFRMGAWRGYYSAVRRGEVYIFAASMATLLYLSRSTCNKRDSIYRVIRFVVGPYEDPEYLEILKRKTNSESSNSANNSRPGRSGTRDAAKESPRRTFGLVWQALRAYESIIKSLKGQFRHSSCPHPDSCAHYILSGGSKLFGIGVAAQLGLQLIFQGRKMIRRPQLLKSAILRKINLNLAVFLGGFTALYRFMSCSLRTASGRDSKYHAIPAGLVASVAFVMFPNNTVALYVMWKALQLLWNQEVENGRLPEVKWFSIFLYCFSTALLFHAAIIEPQNLRPSYFKFLYNLSGGRIASMNRVPLDRFGLESSKHLQDVLAKTNTTDQLTYSF